MLISPLKGLREDLKGGVPSSAHVHKSKYFFAFGRYDLSLFNLIRCFNEPCGRE